MNCLLVDAMARLIFKNASNFKDSFTNEWNGSLQRKGERDRLEMKLCYGSKCKASIFLGNPTFEECFRKLYSPILGSDR